MGNPGSNHLSIDSLQKTLRSLTEIRSALLPFVHLLKDDARRHNRHDLHGSHPSQKLANDHMGASTCMKNQSTVQLTPHRRAEAQAAVALAVCTLRYMGGRLRGLDVGRKKDDPLRMELDKIRGALVSLKKLDSGDVNNTSKDGGNNARGVDSDLKNKGEDGYHRRNMSGNERERREKRVSEAMESTENGKSMTFSSKKKSRST